MSHFKIILCFIIVAALGFFFIPKLSIDLLPDKSLPILVVSFSLNDATPEIIEQEATAPLENALSQLSQIEKIYSVSGYGKGTIEITFNREVDINFKKFEVASVIRNIYNKLNSQITYPQVEQRVHEEESKSPLLVYSINAKLAPFQIRKTAEDVLLPALSQQKGVNQAVIRGAEEIQLTIRYDEDRLEQFGITSSVIVKQLQNEFRTFYPGSLITSGRQRFTIHGGQAPENLEAIENVMIPINSGNYLPLKKIASVFWEESKPRQFFRINGLNSITLAIFADEGVNRFMLGKDLKRILQNIEARVPQGYSVLLDYDDTEFLKKEVDKNLSRSLFSFGILFIFLLISYHNFKYLIILFSGILISLGLTALATYLLGIKIHLYTIAGVTISFGIIIDNSIVVLDHLRTKGDKKISTAVIGASFTTVMALMLVLLLPEEERQSLTEFCIIVSVAIACSVATAVFYTPAMNSTFFSTANRTKLPLKRLRRKVWSLTSFRSLILFLARYRKMLIGTCVLAFGLPLFLLPAKWEDHELYNRTIGNSVYQENIRPYSDKILGGALRLFVQNVYEHSGYREAQQTQLHIIAGLPEGNTLEDMNRVIRDIENYIATFDGIEKYMSYVMSGQYAFITVTFKKESEDSSLPYILKSNLIARSLHWSGVKWNIYGVGQNFSNSSIENLPSFSAEMKGYNYKRLEHYAETMAEKLLKHKRIQEVDINARLNWREKTIEQMVLNFDQGLTENPKPLLKQVLEKSERTIPSTYISVNGHLYPVYPQPINKTPSTYSLLETGLILSDSQHVKLSSIASIHKEITSNAIHKQDRQYIRMLGFEYLGSYQFGNEFFETVLAEMKSEMAPGFTIKRESSDWNWEKAKRQYSLVILLVIGIYLIASILFENLKQPLYIVLTVPLSIIGLFLTFSIFDFYFDQGGYAAFILLGGLVVNASIYIVNDFNNSQNKNYNRGVLKAVTGKIQPITLTILSTCLGLMPFMLGGQNEVFWFALAAGTTGGLLFSLIVVFICLPVFLIKKQ